MMASSLGNCNKCERVDRRLALTSFTTYLLLQHARARRSDDSAREVKYLR
jgi:hypothetical protein